MSLQRAPLVELLDDAIAARLPCACRLPADAALRTALGPLDAAWPRAPPPATLVELRAHCERLARAAPAGDIYQVRAFPRVDQVCPGRYTTAGPVWRLHWRSAAGAPRELTVCGDRSLHQWWAVGTPWIARRRIVTAAGEPIGAHHLPPGLLLLIDFDAGTISP